MKLQRTYLLKIQPNPVANPNSLDKIIEIVDPITIEMDIVRNNFSSANTASIRIYNLGPTLRNQIFHDRYDQGPQFFQQIELSAGYKSSVNTPLARIFLGNIQCAYSYRQKENWITYIEAYDGLADMQNSVVNLSVPTPWNYNNFISQLVETMPHTLEGTLSVTDPQQSRGITARGNTWEIIRRLARYNNAYIDCGILNVTDPNYYISNPGGIPLITSDTGLLGTPRKSGTYVEVDMVFEPRITVNQLIELRSLETIFNGQYKVIGLQHSGPISQATSGRLLTKLYLWQGNQGGALQLAEAA